MKKRFLPMLLAFAMVLTIAPVSASAEALDPGTSPDQSGLGAGGEKFEAVQVLPEPQTAPGIGSIYDVVPFDSDFSFMGLRPSATFEENYYNQLDDFSQAVYNAILNSNLKNGPTNVAVSLNLSQTSGLSPITATGDLIVTATGTSVSDPKLSTSIGDAIIKELYEKIDAAVDPAFSALIYDHPEFSWLVNTERTRGISNYSTDLPMSFDNNEVQSIWNSENHAKTYSNKTVTVSAITFGMSEKGVTAATTEPADNASTTEAFNTANTENLEKITTAISSAKNAIDTKLSGTTSPSTYDTVKAIHDWICENVQYADKDGVDKAKFDNNYRAYQTAYSALVSPRTTVCAGYAKSFKLLCDAYNIPCVVVSGEAGDGNNVKQAHAWNYVQIDNAWYAVDCTWDDQGETIYTDYFLVGSETPSSAGFGGETFSKSHTPSGKWYDTLPYVFAYPKLSEGKYEDTSSKEPLPGNFSFEVDGTVPTVNKANVGQTVTAMFNFNGPNGEASPEITYKWYRQTESGNTPLESKGTNGAEYEVTGDDAGKTLLVYASAEDYKDCENPGRIAIRTPLSDCKITLSDGNKNQFIYDTKPHKPTVVSVTTKDNQTLTENKDYGVSYQMLETGTEVWKALDTSGGVNVGSYRVCITALNGTDADGDNYSGEAYVQYEITKATPDLGTVSVSKPTTIYATTKLTEIELTRTDTSVAGTLALVNTEGTVGQATELAYKFTPTDTNNYESVTDTVSFTVTARAVASITVETNPTKTEYQYGEKFDPAGLVLSVTYNDSTTPEDLAWSEKSGITFNPASDLGDVGTRNVTVTYKEKTTTITVKVDPKTVSLDGVSWNVTAAQIPYDGREHTGATLTGTVPEELVVNEQTGDKGTNVDTYTPSVTFALKEGLTRTNYTLPTSLTVEGTQWKITPGTMTGKNLTRNVRYNDTAEKTISLSEFGITVSGASATVGSADPANILGAQIKGGVLSYKLNEGLSAPTAGTEPKVTIPVTFKAANYTDCTVNVVVTVVDKSVPVLTVNSYSKPYDGKQVTIDDLADRLTAEFDSQKVDGTWAVAEGTTLPTNAGSGSYTLTFTPKDTDTYVTGQTREISITIEKAEATVTAKSYTITVGDELPEYEYTVTGVVESGLGVDITPACEATTESGAGEYAITFSEKPEVANYTITWVDGKLTIAPIAVPTANPASGATFTDSLDVTLDCSTEGASIYYTTDKTDPTAESTLFNLSTPIHLTEDTTIKAIAVKGDNSSEIATFTYTKQPTVVDPDPQPPVQQQVATPVIEPAGGRFYTSVQVRITCATPGATVYYSINNGAFNVFTDAFVLTDSAVVRAYAMAPGMTDSNPATAAFTRYTYTPDPTPDPDPDPEPDNNYEPPVSSNNNNSNNSSNSSTTQPTTPTQPETPTVPEVTARPEATVDGSTASAAVPAETVEKLVEQAVSGKSGTLVIAPVIGGDVTKAEVTLPANAVTAIASATSASLRVETPVAEVTIPNDSLAGLGNQGAEIAVTAEKSEDGGVDVAVVVDGQRVENVPIKAAIPTPCGPGTVAKIVDANGNVISTVRKSSASGDGQTMNVPLDGSAKVVFVDSGKSFPDVPATNWAADAVAFASSHELMNGVNEETFSPSTPMTRGMLAVVLHNLEGNPGASYQGGFSDVTGSAWYAEAVQWASEKKVVTGLSDGVFAPDSPITREQLVVMLYRYMGEPAVSGSSLGRFSDSGTVSDWAAQAMSWAVANGVVNGSNGALNPQGSATRAEVAQMLMNFVSSGML